MNAVDTNVLFYAHDQRYPEKQRVASELIATVPDGALVWQVACEYLWASRKLEPFGYSFLRRGGLQCSERANDSLPYSTESRRVKGGLAFMGSHVALCGFRSRSYGVLDVLELGLPRHTQLVMHLELQPEFWRGAEVSCKPKRRVGGDSPPAANDFVQASGVHRQRLGELVYAHVQWL